MSEKTYRFALAATAAVKGAASARGRTRDEAERRVRDNVGDVVWEYDGVDEDTIEVVAVEEDPR